MFSTHTFYLEQLFCLYLQPNNTVIGTVLYLPPMAEEMHKSRRMAALQAKQLATQGYAVLQIDLSGCGDSLGLFEQADWEQWLNDARAAAAWLQQQYPLPMVLWGLRSGANLALQLATELNVHCLLLWQPLLDGKAFLNQLLRLKLASQLFETNQGEKLSTDSLLQQLNQGQSVEIAGYLITSNLAQQLQAIQLAPYQGNAAVYWFEIANSATPAVQRIVSTWPNIQHQWINGASFWNSQEIIELPELISASCNAIASPTNRLAQQPPRLPSSQTPNPWQETPLIFQCQQQTLLSVLCHPIQPAEIAVCIITGGPQYRAGSHRQFTLLARALASAGIACLRFDYRGMGDSDGELGHFERVDDDIKAAIDQLQLQQPQLKQICLWGLCDGASAALMYAHQDSRITQLILANPWVHTAETGARTQIKHYYLQRLLQKSFWQKIFSGQFAAIQSIRDLFKTSKQAYQRPTTPIGYVERMLIGLQAFKGQGLFIYSENDLVAKEFQALCQQNQAWQHASENTQWQHQTVAEANHTFASANWRQQVEQLTIQWLKQHG